MSLASNFKVAGISSVLRSMLNIEFAKKALLPSLTGGVLTGVAVYKLIDGANLTEARTLLTGYIASGVTLSLDDVLPDMGSFDEAGALLIGGTAAGFIVNAAFGAISNPDTDADGTLSDAEKLAHYETQYAPITQPQRLYASIISGIGVSIAAYAELARSYNVRE